MEWKIKTLWRNTLIAVGLLAATSAGAVSKYTDFGHGTSDSLTVFAADSYDTLAYLDTTYLDNFGGARIKRIVGNTGNSIADASTWSKVSRHGSHRVQTWNYSEDMLLVGFDSANGLDGTDKRALLHGSLFTAIDILDDFGVYADSASWSIGDDFRWFPTLGISAGDTLPGGWAGDTLLYGMRRNVANAASNQLVWFGARGGAILKRINVPMQIVSAPLMDEINADWNGKFIAVCNGRSKTAVADSAKDTVRVVNMYTGAVGAAFHIPAPGFPMGSVYNVGWVQISNKGNLLVVGYESSVASYARVFDVDTTTLAVGDPHYMTASCYHRSPNIGSFVFTHEGWIAPIVKGDVASDAAGNQVLVGKVGLLATGSDVLGSSTIGVVDLATGMLTGIDPNPGGAGSINGVVSVSAKAYRRPGWVYAGVQGMTGRFANEIIALALDGSKRMQRFGVSSADVSDPIGTAADAAPNPVPSPRGTRAIYATDRTLLGEYDGAKAFVVDARPETVTVATNGDIAYHLAQIRYGDVMKVANGTYSTYGVSPSPVAPRPAKSPSAATYPYSITIVGDESTPGNVRMLSPTRATNTLPIRYVTHRGISFNGSYIIAATALAPAVYDSVINCNIDGSIGMRGAKYSGYSGCTVTSTFGPSSVHAESPWIGQHGGPGNFLIDNTMTLRSNVDNSGQDLWRFTADGASRTLRQFTVTNNKVTIILDGEACGGEDGEEYARGVKLLNLRASNFTNNKWTVLDSTSGTCYGKRYIAFWMRDGADSNTFVRDTLIASAGPGFRVDLSSPGAGVDFPSENTWQECVIYNLSGSAANFGWPGVYFHGGLNNSTVDGCQIVLADTAGAFTIEATRNTSVFKNNTVVAVGNGTGAMQVNCGTSNCNGSTFTNKNNIFYTRNTSGVNSYAYSYTNTSGSLPAITQNYNLFANYAGSTNSIRTQISGATNLDAPGGTQCSNYGFDCNSVYGSPVFDDSTLADLDLDINSGGVADGNGEFGSDIGALALATDSVRPEEITTLQASNISSTGGVTLGWVATGDDSLTGTASAYDIRYSTSPISDSNFLSASSAADLVPPPPAPAVAGTTQSFTLQLVQNTTYYFAMKVRDEANNWSAISNGVVLTTTVNPGGTGGGGGIPIDE